MSFKDRELHEPTLLNDQVPVISAYSKKIRTPITFPENSRWTDQSYKDESDINTIMERYQSTGELPRVNDPSNNFMDVSEMEFTHHMNEVTRAKEMFARLHSDIRDRFANSPAHFLRFIEDEKNHKELAEMGLLTPEATKRLLASD